ncbi:MAG TPA: hypothetical protein VMS08_00090 [Candidatus Saccharimonadia bacterium]|nr:hypothetical protein [Candidatus Saccharimonadia bacterium]
MITVVIEALITALWMGVAIIFSPAKDRPITLVFIGCMMLLMAVTVALYLKLRLPKERISTWVVRVFYLDVRADDEPPAEHEYCKLSCGHVGQVRRNLRPHVGEAAWCPGHHRFGPAQRVSIKAILDPVPTGTRIVIDVVLDPA